MRVKYDKFEIYVDAERAPEHPKVYTKIDLKYKFWGRDLTSVKDKIEKAISLSQEKYCSVSAMIRAANIPLTYNYEIVENVKTGYQYCTPFLILCHLLDLISIQFNILVAKFSFRNDNLVSTIENPYMLVLNQRLPIFMDNCQKLSRSQKHFTISVSLMGIYRNLAKN